LQYSMILAVIALLTPHPYLLKIIKSIIINHPSVFV
jgi:hypothetical protein